MTIEYEDLINMESSQDMTRPQIDKMDPRYITACIKQLPTLADPQEVEIIRVMEKEALSTSLARRMIEDEKKIIKSNLRDLLVHLNDTSYTHAKSRQAVVEVAGVVNTKIVSGHEKLQGLEKGRPVFLSANHLGVYKLVGLSPDDLADIDFQADHEIPSIYYSPIAFYAPFYPVAKELGDDVYIAAMEEPGHLGELSRATGYVDVPPSVDVIPESNGTGVGRVEILTESSRKFFEERPDSAILVFPEGGTTGKRTGGNPYNLEKFHSGLFVIASKLEVPIVFLAHHFDPNKGFEVAVAGVTQLNKDSTREEIQKAASDAHELTQVTLDNMRAK